MLMPLLEQWIPTNSILDITMLPFTTMQMLRERVPLQGLVNPILTINQNTRGILIGILRFLITILN